MTKEELEHARDTIEAAEKLVKLIDILNDASVHKSGRRCMFVEFNTNTPVLDEHLLKEVISIGVVTLRERYEAELSRLYPRFERE